MIGRSINGRCQKHQINFLIEATEGIVGAQDASHSGHAVRSYSKNIHFSTNAWKEDTKLLGALNAYRKDYLENYYYYGLIIRDIRLHNTENYFDIPLIVYH